MTYPNYFCNSFTCDTDNSNEVTFTFSRGQLKFSFYVRMQISAKRFVPLKEIFHCDLQFQAAVFTFRIFFFRWLLLSGFEGFDSQCHVQQLETKELPAKESKFRYFCMVMNLKQNNSWIQYKFALNVRRFRYKSIYCQPCLTVAVFVTLGGNKNYKLCIC